jgi:hypothetical protein
MFFNIFAPLQALAKPKFQLALFFVAFFVAKLLHLGSHAAYTPTFFLPDVLLLVGSKTILYRFNGGQSSLVRKSFGGILA